MEQVVGRLKVVERVCTTGIELRYSTRDIRNEMQ